MVSARSWRPPTWLHHSSIHHSCWRTCDRGCTLGHTISRATFLLSWPVAKQRWTFPPWDTDCYELNLNSALLNVCVKCNPTLLKNIPLPWAGTSRPQALRPEPQTLSQALLSCWPCSAIPGCSTLSCGATLLPHPSPRAQCGHALVHTAGKISPGSLFITFSSLLSALASLLSPLSCHPTALHHPHCLCIHLNFLLATWSFAKPLLMSQQWGQPERDVVMQQGSWEEPRPAASAPSQEGSC